MSTKKSIVCYGEVLWDMLPTGKVAGGAPMNVAFHANNFGMDAQMISAVGQDELGQELLQFLTQKGIATNFIVNTDALPTSTVEVTLNETGSASYEIVEPVAWDTLLVDEAMIDAVAKSDYLLFGSLICRSANNVRQLFRLLEKANTVVFDVNLRPPFYSQSLLEILLKESDIVKMNEDELALIADWYGAKKDMAGQMTFLKDKFKIATLLISKGKDGACCLHDKLLVEQGSFPVEVQDTVGSGDSFLAAFLYQLSQGSSWQACLEFACATGALVATKSGGTPDLNEGVVKDFIAAR